MSRYRKWKNEYKHYVVIVLITKYYSYSINGKKDDAVYGLFFF